MALPFLPAVARALANRSDEWAGRPRHILRTPPGLAADVWPLWAPAAAPAARRAELARLAKLPADERYAAARDAAENEGLSLAAADRMRLAGLLDHAARLAAAWLSVEGMEWPLEQAADLERFLPAHLPRAFAGDPGRGPSVVGAALRSLRPARLLAALVGVLLTVGVLHLFLLGFVPNPPKPAAWLEDPASRLREVGETVAAPSLGWAARRGAWLFVGLGMVWGLVGCFIARSELVAARCGTNDAAALRFVRKRGRSLLSLPGAIVLLVAFLLGLLAFAGLVLGHLPVLGPLVLALLSPVLLVVGTAAVLIGGGAVSFVIMPAALAAEGTDSWDALSRGYSYLFAGLRFVLVLAAVAAVSLAPAAAVLYFAPQAGPFALLGVAAVGLSLFGSLLAWLYLHLRRAVDETPEGELWLEEEEDIPRPPKGQPDPEVKKGPEPIPTVRLLGLWLSCVAFAYLGWRVCYATLDWASGGNVGWIAWGIDGLEVPPAQGFEKVTSVIAGILLAFAALWVLLWPLLRRAKAADEEAPEAATKDEGPAG